MIDFTKLYEENWGRNYGDDETKETAEFWDKKAKDFSRKAHDEYARAETLDFLNRFVWNPSETVLDVGAGPGTHSIPLARFVKEIVASDFSESMLNELKQRALQENIDNIKIVQSRWLDLELPDKFDTVLCLNSLGVVSCGDDHKSRLIDTLLKLKKYAMKRLIILIPHADSPLDENMRKILNIGNLTLERHRIAVLYHAMIDCGMLPSLTIIEKPFRWIFTDIKEASATLLAKSGMHKCSPDAWLEFEDYLSKILQQQKDGKLCWKKNTKQALYTNYF